MFPFVLPAVLWSRAPAVLDPLAGSLPGPGRVALAVAGYLGVALLAGAVTRWRGRRYYEDPDGDAETARRIRRLRQRGILAGWLLTAVVTVALDVASAAAAAAVEVLPDAVAVTAAPVAAYLLPVVPVAVAVRLAALPYRRATRGFRVRYRDAAAWELERDGVGLVVVLGGATVLALVPAGPVRVLAAVGLGLVGTALAPVALVVALRTRWPTDEERALLDDVLGDCRLRVVDDRTRVGSAFAAGVLPGLRYVFLTESLFDALDDEGVRAVAAHEVGHHERNHVLLRYALVAVAAAGALALLQVVPAGLALWAVLGGAVPYGLGLAWVVRATERSADAYAARTVGGPALARALEELAERRYIVEGGGRFPLLSHHPPVGERIASLRRSAT